MRHIAGGGMIWPGSRTPINPDRKDF